jgi:hypothetical protein
MSTARQSAERTARSSLPPAMGETRLPPIVRLAQIYAHASSTSPAQAVSPKAFLRQRFPLLQGRQLVWAMVGGWTTRENASWAQCASRAAATDSRKPRRSVSCAGVWTLRERRRSENVRPSPKGPSGSLITWRPTGSRRRPSLRTARYRARISSGISRTELSCASLPATSSGWSRPCGVAVPARN